MDYIENLFAAIKLMFLQVILAEIAIIRMIVMPPSMHVYLQLNWSIDLYIQHIVLSIVFLALGALIFLKKADFFVQNRQE